MTKLERFIVCLVLIAFLYSILMANAQKVDPMPIHLDKGWYQIDYRPDLGIPSKVSWMVRQSDLGTTKRKPTFRFRVDRNTPDPRITSALYTLSGYQRGHMCPAADRSVSKDAMLSTFVMSNICPMSPSINTGAWKITEERARFIARQVGCCSVIAAPLFFPWDTLRIGKGRIAVPHAFFKILFTSNPSRVFNWYIIENGYR